MSKKKKRAKKRSKKSSRGRRNSGRRQRQSRSRFTDLAIVAMLLLAAYFAIFGGEYSVFELKRLEALEQERAAQLARSEAQIDSLRTVATRLKNDPAQIERVARERYGMIREGEILYRFLEPASSEEGAKAEDQPAK